MRILLDENVPRALVKLLGFLLRDQHQLSHVRDLGGWRGTADPPLYERAVADGFDAILTNDGSQMGRRMEVEAIARSGLHRIEYRHRHTGVIGLGLAVATICAAFPAVLAELTAAGGQRLVDLRSVDPAREHRYAVRDPAVDPPKFWPRRVERPP